MVIENKIRDGMLGASLGNFVKGYRELKII